MPQLNGYPARVEAAPVIDTSVQNDRTVFVFPGQGTQYVGMGKALYEASQAAQRVFQQADEVLGFQLSKMCFEGPEDELQDTLNAQPAILTVSVACLAALREKWEGLGRDLQPLYVAGHSLGEYTALVAADVLDFADALRLVRERGRLMKESGDYQPGGMAAVIGLSQSVLQEICDEASQHGIIVIANSNSPEQSVLSGERPALDRAIELARERGAQSVVPLRISIASHSPLMQQVALQLADLLAHIPFRDPSMPLVANIQGQILTTAEEIRRELSEQICRPVEWTRSIREMIENGADTFVEIGPGQVLSKLIKRINRDVEAHSLNDKQIVKL
jgi:[acyl-carrier-protein] S-malonyltransferase